MSSERAKKFGCRIVGATLVGLLPVLIPAWPAHAGGDILLPGETSADNLYFEPIEGLTTVRHLAPRQTAIPLGVQLRLFLQAPLDAQVSMTGAIVIGRNPDGVSAVCPLNQVGPLTIRGVVQMPDGTTKTSTCKLNVVAIPISEIAVTAVTPSVAPFDLGENATNEQTTALFFGESIAALRPVATWGVVSESGDAAPRRRRGQATTSRYLTSIDRTIRMVAEVNHADFKPLMEWRVNGAAFAMGQETERAFYHTGTHSVEVGPPANSAQLKFETYSVSIVSHSGGEVYIPEGEFVTFEAVTEPPGYEKYILWLSSTKYGTAEPVGGFGRTFTVQFNDTWGDGPSQWLGVKADNGELNQDPPRDCCTPGVDPFGTNTAVPSSITFDDTPPDPPIPAIPAGFFGPGSDLFEGTVELVGMPRNDLLGDPCDTADTFVLRLGPVICPDPPPSACNQVGIRMVGLRLTATEPITVTFNSGQDPSEDWLVALVSAGQQDTGVLSADLETATGGTYTADLRVNVKIVFVKESAALAPGPDDIKTLTRSVDMSLPTPVPWTRIEPSDGGFFCPPRGSDIGNEFFPGESGAGSTDEAAAAAEGVDCDTCIQCSGSGCHGGPGHTHCICRPVPCATRCRYTKALGIPFPACVGLSLAPDPLISPFACNQALADPDACCASPGIPPFGMGLFPCLLGGFEIAIYTNDTMCVP